MKKKYKSLKKQFTAFALFGIFIFSSASWAQPTIPGYYGKAADLLPPAFNALPSGVLKKQGIKSITELPNNRMVIEQNEKNAIIHWQEFNIGEQASVHFDQHGNTNWKALNRIYDKNPSQIFGRLTADGKVYLINQNGILFGPNSRVNVHDLVASALNISDESFINELLHLRAPGSLENALIFRAENYNPDQEALNPDAAVSNHGIITTTTQGTVFLIGPQVENGGTINTPDGQIGLIAGTEATLYEFLSGPEELKGRNGLTISNVKSDNAATNFKTGNLLADRGLVGMYGKIVNQEGLISSVRAVERNGQIELIASDKIRTGPESITVIPVSPSSDRSLFDQENFRQSKIDFQAKRIEHNGKIYAPNGQVTFQADDRIFLENGSSIDVSGSEVKLSADQRIADVQLNTQELRDAFQLKNGPLLGKTVQVDTVKGLSVADVSGSLVRNDQTALERTVEGGTIKLLSKNEVIVKKDADLNFAGGSLTYDDGLIETTSVRIGNKIYNINDVPRNQQIDSPMDYFSRVNDRFGMKDEWHGVYYGGSTPLKEYLPGFTRGADAGSLIITGKKVVVDGLLDGSVYRGIYQTVPEEDANEPEGANNFLGYVYDEDGNVKAVGQKIPVAGTFKLIGGNEVGLKQASNKNIEAILVKKDVEAVTIGPDDALPIPDEEFYTSVLSAGILNAAGLQNIQLEANNVVGIDKDADIQLAAGGEFSVSTRRIEHYGQVTVPGGTVKLTINETITDPNSIERNADDPLVELQNRIYLAPESVIDVSGEKVDNFLAGNTDSGPLLQGIINGGVISVKDNTITGVDKGVIVAQDATLDVSGGYSIDPKGDVEGGDAGSINLVGGAIAVEGILKGHTLEGGKGGSITFHANNISVKKSSPSLPAEFDPASSLPESMQKKFVFSENLLDGTGFSNITLISENDLLFDHDVTIKPSLTRLAEPSPGVAASSSNSASSAIQTQNPTGSGLIEGMPELARPSDVVLTAGKLREDGSVNLNAKIDIPSGTSIEMSPGGSISASANGDITIGGDLKVPGGDVTLVTGSRQLTLVPGSTIDVAGINIPDYASSNGILPVNFISLPGGTVNLTAHDVVISEDASINVSGSAPVTNKFFDENGSTGSLVAASNPGGISVSYVENFQNDGAFDADAKLTGLPGGSLTITRNNSDKSLALSAADIASYQEQGFDDLSFKSHYGIEFGESMSLDAGRILTLDAPRLIGGGQQDVFLKAPWVRLQNTKDYNAIEAALPGDAKLNIQAGFVDITGDIQLDGFQTTSILVDNDLRLTDKYYGRYDRRKWSGLLETAGDLTLQAAAIYPTTQSDFTIQAGGKVTTLPGKPANQRPIYSAAGKLTVRAQEIEHRGRIAAPHGEVVLEAPGGRVTLADGSSISTKGEDLVLYGSLDQDENWLIHKKRNPLPSDTIPEIVDTPLEDAPEKSVSISGSKIVQMPGAEIDVSGGGSVISYVHLPGLEGSKNPLEVEGRYVILPGNAGVLPGKAVYLDGVEGLPAGTYSLLPDEYAFLPGAFIIEDLGSTFQQGKKTFTVEGYPVATGYETYAGTDIQSPARKAYSVRPALDVLAEGKIVLDVRAAGNAGTLTIDGDTTILAGSIAGAPLTSAYKGASLSFIGKQIEYGTAPKLQSNGTALDQEIEKLGDTFLIDDELFKGAGVEELNLGFNPDDASGSTAETIIMKQGSILEDVPEVSLAAQDIIMEPGAKIHAVGDGTPGVLTLKSDTLEGSHDTLLHASDLINYGAKDDRAFQGDLAVDGGSLNFIGDIIYVASDGYTGERNPGMYVTQKRLDRIADIANVGMVSDSDIVFLGDVELNESRDFTFDASRLIAEGSSNVVVNTDGLLLKNTSGNTANSVAVDSPTTISMNANDVTLGPGAVLFDGFKTIGINSTGGMTFQGDGQLTASLPADGAMNFTASRYLSDIYEDADGNFQATDYRIDAGQAELTFSGTGESAPASRSLPGKLSVEARKISIASAANFDIPAGILEFTATGSAPTDGLFVEGGSSVAARGGLLDFTMPLAGETYTKSLPYSGGLVAMHTENGAIKISVDSVIDVSATDGQDAGGIELYAPDQGVDLQGNILGSGGEGGSFVMDTKKIDDFSALNAKLEAGRFSKARELRSRTGDVMIAETDNVTAHDFKLVADSGKIDVHGTIDASGTAGGSVEMLANGNLTAYATSNIVAQGTGADAEGGEVFLGSSAGTVTTEAGAHIDVSGSGAGNGGTVTYRAERSADSVKVDLNGDTVGAAKEKVQAFKAFDLATTKVNTSNVNTWMSDATAFMSNVTWGYAGIDLIPEIEVRYTGDMSLESGFNALYARRFGVNRVPGVLTFRAGNNLTVNTDVIDAPTTGGTNYLLPSNWYDLLETQGLDGRDSWSLNFIAGADFSGADYMATKSGIGDFKIGSTSKNITVFTEKAPIRFASAGDTIISESGSRKDRVFMPGPVTYNLASFVGDIDGQVGGNLTLDNSVIQTGMGDISLNVGGGLALKKAGAAIRTTGRPPLSKDVPVTLLSYLKAAPVAASSLWLARYWQYEQGGKITIDAGGSLTTDMTKNEIIGSAWDALYKELFLFPGDTPQQWGAGYGPSLYNQNVKATQGIATLAGGNLNLSFGGDVSALAGAFGAGDVTIASSGDIDGRFMVREGTGTFTASGNFGTGVTNSLFEKNQLDTVIEAGDTQLAVNSLGSIKVGTITNPTIANDLEDQWVMTYETDSSARFTNAFGDVALSGNNPYRSLSSDRQNRLRILPPSLTVEAGRDIVLTQSFAMAPSPAGDLTLIAGRDIDGKYEVNSKFIQARIYMSDADPEKTLGNQQEAINAGLNSKAINAKLFNDGNPEFHAPTPIHVSDNEAIAIKAGQDIRHLQLYLPKKAEVSAGRNLQEIFYSGQNLNDADVTVISAGGDIDLQKSLGFNESSTNLGLVHGGPGFLLVTAGNSIDLGTSDGIISVGDTRNFALAADINELNRSKGSDLAVVAGYDLTLTEDEFQQFFADLQEEGDKYNKLLADEQSAAAKQVLDHIRNNIIAPLIAGKKSGSGHINMLNSTINTQSGRDNIYILAAGDIDVGRTAFFENAADRKNTGIYTAGGGAINICTVGQLNVNESRVMTFLGGPIVIYTDKGNIEAGRGSTTAVTLNPGKLALRGDQLVPVFDPPAVGSGIRAFSFDPRVKEGNIVLVAPEGYVDAGEAGIAGANVSIGAQEVRNSDNIASSQGSVGVPSTGGSGPSLGALAGSSNVTEAGNAADSATQLAPSGEKLAAEVSKVGEDFQVKLYKVKFIGFAGPGSGEESADQQNTETVTPADQGSQTVKPRDKDSQDEGN